MATENYTKHDWQTGETITEALLDNMEAGIESAVKGVQSLEAAAESAPAISSVQVETLEAGQAATATIEDGVLKLGIPKGEKGDQGEAGEPGQEGAPGADGEDGQDGDPGERGSKIEFVTQAPSDTEGRLEGDMAINTVDWKVFAFKEGAWAEQGTIKGADGAKGADGKDGAKGDPGEPGEDGQDGTNGKDGAPGQRGSKIEFVAEAPSETDGYLEGDMAVNTTDWKVYAFESGSWAEKGTIKGADGAQGTTGADGEDGAPGAAGKQGASYRITTETFSASKADCQASAVAPSADVLPIIVGDLIEDATGAVWQVASVSDSTFTVGAAAVKAAVPAA